MKIVCISASVVPSSTANSIQAMKACQALAQLGHEVRLVVPVPSPAAGRERRDQGGELLSHYGLSTPFPVEWLSGSSRRAFTWLAVRRAAGLRAGLVYTWVPQSAVFALLHGLPVILEMHELPAGRAGPLWHRLFLLLAGRRRLLVITRALMSALDERYGVQLPPADVILAPNGVELDRFADLPAPEGARRLVGLPDAQTALCAGHLYAGRGVELFLTLAQALPETRFVWVGGSPEEVDKWQPLAEARALGNLTFTGFIANEALPLYLAAADVLLMPYARNIGISSGGGHSALVSSPMKMFEYLAAGRPILASDLPVFREVLDERNATLCPPEDAATWTQALRDLLANPKKREALSIQARADAARYTWVERARRALDGFLD